MTDVDVRSNLTSVALIEKAGQEGVQVLSFQDVFTKPYFCLSEDAKWYAVAEAIPGGATVKLMQGFAKKFAMVIVAPIYEDPHGRIEAIASSGRNELLIRHPPNGLRHDPRSPQQMAVLPRTPAGNLRSAH